MQHRKAVVQMVFDVFYEIGFSSIAVNFQNEMRTLWRQHLPGETWRMMWGTYEDADSGGEQLDMSRAETQGWYYDAGEYEKLQAVKTSIDPRDVFHTSFTVRPG